jgi:hypothetical protein
MVLFCFAGELGSGKTLSLTFLTWKNWFYRKKPVYANYHLYKIPYTMVDSVEKLDLMKEGFFAADEFWLWVDALNTKEKKNRVVTNILLKSRKRGLTYCYTAQTLEQLNRRVRKVQDFTAYPILNTSESVCKCVVFRTGFPNSGTYMKTFYFKSDLFMSLYDHTEEVEPIKEIDENPNGGVTWQEDKTKAPIIFATWEEADKFAEEYWQEKYKSLKGVI